MLKRSFARTAHSKPGLVRAQPTARVNTSASVTIKHGTNDNIDITPKELRRHPWNMDATSANWNVNLGDESWAPDSAKFGGLYVAISGPRELGELEGVTSIDQLEELIDILLCACRAARIAHPELNNRRRP